MKTGVMGGLFKDWPKVMAKKIGAKMAILNREPTDLDSYADLVVHEEIGSTLGAAVGLN